MSLSFEQAVERTMGERMRAEAREATTRGPQVFAVKVCESISNVEWIHDAGSSVDYTHREAGDVVADIIGEGSYMDWYSRCDWGVVDPEVAELMAPTGWRPR